MRSSHGSGKWPLWRLNSSSRETKCSISMIVGRDKSNDVLFKEGAQKNAVRDGHVQGVHCKTQFAVSPRDAGKLLMAR